ncbi:DUF2304 domain-containing protein [Propioniciclava coleopterorum]|uniref:DUF2304 domain-containing protein n=1 Tax=Propioniciclava coleopterorum TaxID=2714937 RepID=A0A6G7Y4A9_9ACTN|nr:DUF2304 domain-containing protein [Propioniciclava coleopterorum]QIK71724.1 DUF2304 domain-containing protein [Propioniciclava coleopterorum]
MTPSSITFLTVAVVVAIALIWVLRSGRIREKYVGLWIIIGLATIVLALWPGLLTGLTGLLGFVLPANLLFFVAILLLMGVCLHLSYEASKLEEETRMLAEEITLLNARLDKLQGRLEETDQP